MFREYEIIAAAEDENTEITDHWLDLIDLQEPMNEAPRDQALNLQQRIEELGRQVEKLSQRLRRFRGELNRIASDSQ